MLSLLTEFFTLLAQLSPNHENQAKRNIPS